jgi:hypothetical protein
VAKRPRPADLGIDTVQLDGGAPPKSTRIPRRGSTRKWCSRQPASPMRLTS